jgi:uncharacterized cupin superfamily protein
MKETAVTKPVINVADLELVPRPEQYRPKGANAELYGLSMARIAERLGAKQLGYNVTAVPPGKRAFPYHSHRVNEEMFFVLQGTGEVRFADATYPLRAGDVVACPAGGPESAHQIVNTGTEELRYLAVSTTSTPEICEYPDSAKFGVWDERDDQDGKAKLFRFMGRDGQGLDYWDGE